MYIIYVRQLSNTQARKAHMDGSMQDLSKHVGHKFYFQSAFNYILWKLEVMKTFMLLKSVKTLGI